MDRFEVDVVIVGAGPAGCRAAGRLAAGGARVALVDGSHPREKPCGGGVTGRALDLVRDAIDEAALGAVAIEAASFEHDGARMEMPLAGGSARRPPRLAVVPRRSFDAALLAAAVRAGARLVAGRATRIARAGAAATDGWEVATADRTLRARWLLGADGPNSLVRRSVHRPFERADLSIATGFFVHGATSRTIAIAFEDDPAGYLWSFPRADHLAVGVCAQADASSTRALLPIASRWIERHVTTPSRLERYSWPIPSLGVAALRREPPSGDGWMLLGDAGGMVDPITREGIYFALWSGDAAAESLLSARDPASRYADQIRGSVHDELLRAARLKAQFFNPRFTRLLIHALRRSAPIRAIMADLIAGRQPYRGLRRRLLATFELRLLGDYLRM